MRDTTYVRLSCNGDRVATRDVEFLNIEENAYGEDTLTYTCPVCGEQHKSIVTA